LKKNSIVENPERENDSVGHTPTQPPQLIHSTGVNAGILLLDIIIVSTGQISTHLVHSENLLVALIQEVTSNFKYI
jgi:hypothetical protein